MEEMPPIFKEHLAYTSFSGYPEKGSSVLVPFLPHPLCGLRAKKTKQFCLETNCLWRRKGSKYTAMVSWERSLDSKTCLNMVEIKNAENNVKNIHRNNLVLVVTFLKLTKHIYPHTKIMKTQLKKTTHSVQKVGLYMQTTFSLSGP